MYNKDFDGIEIPLEDRVCKNCVHWAEEALRLGPEWNTLSGVSLRPFAPCKRSAVEIGGAGDAIVLLGAEGTCATDYEDLFEPSAEYIESRLQEEREARAIEDTNRSLDRDLAAGM